MIVNAYSIVQHVIQIKNGVIKHVNVNSIIIVHAKKVIIAIAAHVFVRIASNKKVLLINKRLRVMKLYMLWILHQQK